MWLFLPATQGPLFDAERDVVGILVAKYIGGGAEELGLFIPIADVLSTLGISISKPQYGLYPVSKTLC
jgi:hypothetical protein